MPLCSVITCKCSLKGHNGVAEGLSFHSFPANAEIKAKWVDMTGRDGWAPTSNDFVCSRHFRDNDYFIKRSGKRYLKTSAIPCEYVVYRGLYFDEDVDVKFEVKEAEASVAVDDHAQEPEPVLIPDQEPEDNNGVAEQPDISPTFVPAPANQEPDIDSTIGTIYDMNENGVGDWERFRPHRYFGKRLPLVSMFEENSQEVGSSGFDDRYRDVGWSKNPYPLDLRPQLERLPPPRTPEPAAQSIEQEHMPDAEEDIPEPSPSPAVEGQRGRKKLENIKRIMRRRKSSKKEQDKEPRASRRRSRGSPGQRNRGVSSSSD